MELRALELGAAALHRLAGGTLCVELGARRGISRRQLTQEELSELRVLGQCAQGDCTEQLYS